MKNLRYSILAGLFSSLKDFTIDRQGQTHLPCQSTVSYVEENIACFPQISIVFYKKEGRYEKIQIPARGV